MTLRGNFSLQQLSWLRKHWLVDVSTKEAAFHLQTTPEAIMEAAKFLKLKITSLGLTGFHTPYPCEIARKVRKAVNPLYSENFRGQSKVHSADP